MSDTFSYTVHTEDISFTYGLATESRSWLQNLRDVLEKTLRSGLTLPSSQELDEILMQYWTEMNLDVVEA